MKSTRPFLYACLPFALLLVAPSAHAQNQAVRNAFKKFNKVPGTALNGHNMRNLRQTSARCAASCVGVRGCVSFDYDKKKGVCDLSTKVASDVPKDVARNKGYDHYVLRGKHASLKPKHGGKYYVRAVDPSFFLSWIGTKVRGLHLDEDAVLWKFEAVPGKRGQWYLRSQHGCAKRSAKCNHYLSFAGTTARIHKTDKVAWKLVRSGKHWKLASQWGCTKKKKDKRCNYFLKFSRSKAGIKGVITKKGGSSWRLE